MQRIIEQLTMPVYGMTPVAAGDEYEAAWGVYVAQEVRKLCPEPKSVVATTTFNVRILFLMHTNQVEQVHLEHLAQPVLDILFQPHFVRTEYTSLTGTLFKVGYERIFKLALEKRHVANEAQAGAEITVTWE